jgi:hypothetical protein
MDNKSLYFSGDTFYDPEVIKQYVSEGKLSKRRGQQLCDGIWECDVILHEAGIPPIHTPVRVLRELDQ